MKKDLEKAEPLLNPSDPDRGSYENEKSERNVVYPLLLSCLAAIGSFLFGWTLGFSAPSLIPMENRNDGDFPSPLECVEYNTDDKTAENYGLCKTSPQGDLFGSIVNIGCMGGAFVGYFMDRIGRRGGLAAACLPFAGGFAWIALTDSSYTQLIIARILTGFAVGMVSCTVPVFIAEVAPPDLRGALGCINQLAITIGIFAVYASGIAFEKEVTLTGPWDGNDGKTTKKFADWPLIAWVGAVVAAAYFVLTVFLLPESPKWLVSKGKVAEARVNLTNLRGGDFDVDSEIDEQISASKASDDGSPTTFRDLLAPENREQMFVGCSLMVLQQFTGINAVIFFSTEIFSDAGVKGSEGSVIVMAVQVVVTAFACLVVDRAGRKLLLYVASLGMIFSSLAMATFYFLKDGGNQLNNLAILSMICYIIFFSMGMGAIPWLLMSEIFPAKVRGKAGSVATAINWTCSFIMTETFSMINNALGPALTFVAFAVELTVTFFFVWKYVPETKGKTLEEITRSFE